jgi:hypothetical protein
MNKCQELFSRCDPLEDTVAEEASALEILNISEANSQPAFSVDIN